MPKKEVAQELKEEFNKGNFKPSQLKRSKSADDIANNNNPPTPLLQEQLAEKQKQIENLRTKLAQKKHWTNRDYSAIR